MKVTLKRINEKLKIDIDGKSYVPLSFKSFRPNPKNITEFYNAGIKLFSVLFGGIPSALGVPYSLFGDSWIGERTYDFSVVDKQMDMFIKNAPDAYFAPMIQLDTREWYLKSHPETPNSFTNLSQTAYDEEWKRLAADYLKATIKHCEEKYGDRIYGYFLLCGTTTEWFSEYDYEETHPLKEEGYKRWSNDDNAKIPSPERLNRKGDVFLAPDEDDVYRARKFHSETISNLILYFASEAQEILSHQKLLGVYYGYLFQLGGERLYNVGALDYEKVFLSNDIDMISSPSNYSYRKQSDASGFMVTQQTLDIHNKLYFLEFDHITHVAPEEIHEPDTDNSGKSLLVKIPGAANKCKNEVESLNLMYRDFLLCNGSGAALWWFDMFDGWFRSDNMMKCIKNMIDIGNQLAEVPCKSVAEIAVVAEGKSMYRARKSAGLATGCLMDILRTLAECGAPYHLVSMCDLPRIAKKDYKLYLFINQYDISDENKEIISKLFAASGKTALWLYAPDYASAGALDVNNIKNLTGINVEQRSVSHGAMLYNGQSCNYETPAPYFSINDNDAKALAYYEDGAVAAACKGNQNYVSACNLPSELLRDIASSAGVFLYSRNNHLYTYANSETVGVYNATNDDATLYVKSDGVWYDMLSGREFTAVDGEITIPNTEIHAFLLRKKQ